MRSDGFETAVEAAAGRFAVLLDGKPLKTPYGTAMVLPTRALADAVAAEWRGQKRHKPDITLLGLTRIAATALDLVPAQRPKALDDLIAYAETDLICHRAEAPPDLVQRQQRIWQPLLDWCAVQFDAPLALARGIVVQKQPDATIATLRRVIARYDDFRLAALAVAVGAAGSLVIGLALVEARLDPAGAFDAAELDASFQIERWGEDPEAVKRRAGVRDDLEITARLVALLA
jgi:chaperone required for assembly of F1-ATPase